MRKSVLLLIILGGLALTVKPAHAQDVNYCWGCNRNNAQCTSSGAGGCGCVSGYNPRTHTYSCAVCGFCLGFCQFPCGGGGGAVVAAEPWMTSPTLNNRVKLQSPHMATLLDNFLAPGGISQKMCGNMHGTVLNKETHERFEWTLLKVKNGRVFIIDNEDGTHERLALTNKTWVLTRPGLPAIMEHF